MYWFWCIWPLWNKKSGAVFLYFDRFYSSILADNNAIYMPFCHYIWQSSEIYRSYSLNILLKIVQNTTLILHLFGINYLDLYNSYFICLFDLSKYNVFTFLLINWPFKFSCVFWVSKCKVDICIFVCPDLNLKKCVKKNFLKRKSLRIKNKLNKIIYKAFECFPSLFLPWFLHNMYICIVAFTWIYIYMI